MAKILNNEEDFKWFKRRLDCQYEEERIYTQSPTEYPCKVEVSNFYDMAEGTGADLVFTYQEKIICSECGHVEVRWPVEDK